MPRNWLAQIVPTPAVSHLYYLADLLPGPVWGPDLFREGFQMRHHFTQVTRPPRICASSFGEYGVIASY